MYICIYIFLILCCVYHKVNGGHDSFDRQLVHNLCWPNVDTSRNVTLTGPPKKSHLIFVKQLF